MLSLTLDDPAMGSWNTASPRQSRWGAIHWFAVESQQQDRSRVGQIRVDVLSDFPDWQLETHDLAGNMSTILTLKRGSSTLGDEAFRRILAELAKMELVHQTETIINQNAARRLAQFMDYLGGWDDGRGRPLDPGSLVAFGQLLSFLSFGNKHDVGLFMSPDGFLVLNWRRGDDTLTELEVAPDGLLAYSEADDSETAVPLIEGQIRAYLERYG